MQAEMCIRTAYIIQNTFSPIHLYYIGKRETNDNFYFIRPYTLLLHRLTLSLLECSVANMCVCVCCVYVRILMGTIVYLCMLDNVE